MRIPIVKLVVGGGMASLRKIAEDLHRGHFFLVVRGSGGIAEVLSWSLEKSKDKRYNLD